MVPLVEIPELVRHYAPYFEGVFSEQALEQFKRYISGLLVSENKTVDGINRLFVYDVRHQSSLNRLLTDSRFGGLSSNGTEMYVGHGKCYKKPIFKLKTDRYGLF